MKSFTKGLLGVTALAATGILSACGGGGGGPSTPAKGGGTTTPVIIVHGGFWGYYIKTVFCDYGNNYCGTGLAYGITGGGLYYNGIYYTSGPVSSGVPSSSGGSSSGTSSGGTSSGTTSGGTTSGGYTSGGTTSGGTTSGGYTSGGSASGGYTSGGSYSGGSYSGGSGGYTSGGSYSGGSGGYYYYSSGGSDGTSSGTALTQGTTDVNMQRGLAQNAQLDAMAQSAANQFQMSFEAARQLTQLANKMQILQQSGQMTDDDRAALARSALAVAGVEESEVTDAVAKAAQGDHSAIDAVMTKAASNLGMPSSAMLRDQILPSLGVNVP